MAILRRLEGKLGQDVRAGYSARTEHDQEQSPTGSYTDHGVRI